MSRKRKGIWCVEVVFRCGVSEIEVFDSADTATEFLKEITRYRFRHGMRIKTADVWEM